MTEIPEQVKVGYELVRQSGACNMIDRSCVKEVAEEMELDELIEFIEDGNYAEILDNYSREWVELV